MDDHELPDHLYEELKSFCREGDDLADKGFFKEAYQSYTRAWELIPEPKVNWEASAWVLTALGDVLFLRQQFEDAKNLFLHAAQCPGGLGNPFVHLRLGQCQYETGNVDGAKDNLARAYMGGGPELFDDEDLKYYQFLLTFLVI